MLAYHMYSERGGHLTPRMMQMCGPLWPYQCISGDHGRLDQVQLWASEHGQVNREQRNLPFVEHLGNWARDQVQICRSPEGDIMCR